MKSIFAAFIIFVSQAIFANSLNCSSIFTDHVEQKASFRQIFVKNEANFGIQLSSAETVSHKLEAYFDRVKNTPKQYSIAYEKVSEKILRDLFYEISLLPDYDVSKLRARYKNLIPDLEMAHKPHWNNPNDIWAFVLRDITYIKERIDFLYAEDATHPAQEIETKIVDYVNQLKSLNTDTFLDIFGPFIRHYSDLSKYARIANTVSRKRLADHIISIVAEKAFLSSNKDFELRIKAYYDSIEKIILKYNPDYTPISSFSKIVEFSKKIKSLMAQKNNPNLRLVIMGSSVNGKLKKSSDVDYAVFNYKDDEYTAYDLPIQNELKILGPDVTAEQILFDFETPQEMILFGLKVNAVVLEISGDSIIYHVRDARIITESTGQIRTGYRSFQLLPGH